MVAPYGSELGRFFLPSFTSIAQFQDRIAAKTYEMLTKIINGEDYEGKHFIEPELIQRDSTMRTNSIQSKIDVPQMVMRV